MNYQNLEYKNDKGAKKDTKGNAVDVMTQASQKLAVHGQDLWVLLYSASAQGTDRRIRGPEKHTFNFFISKKEKKTT